MNPKTPEVSLVDLQPGKTVTWNDPDEGLTNKTGVIKAATYLEREPEDNHPLSGTEAVSIIFMDGGELECLMQELVPVG